MTVQVAVKLPSLVFTVIVAVPDDIPLTSPDELTVATASLDELHVTAVLAASLGAIVAVSVELPPMASSSDVLLSETPVTGIPITVTAQFAVLFPSEVVTVIFATPIATAVTTPVELTVATAVLDELHVTAVLVASLGDIVALRVAVFPIMTERVLLESVTPVTGLVTVTTQEAVLLPSVVVTVIVAEPAEIAVTKPEELTVATEALEELQEIDAFEALAGETVAVSDDVAPTDRLREELERDTLVTAMVLSLVQDDKISPSDNTIKSDNTQGSRCKFFMAFIIIIFEEL